MKRERKSLGIDQLPSTSSSDMAVNVRRERSEEEEESSNAPAFGSSLANKHKMPADSARKPVKYQSTKGH